MAGSTTNLNLIKPTYEEDADIADINANMDIIDTAANAIEKGIAIVSNNNTHAAIASGSYVYVRNHGSLSEGLYTANTNISANATLSSSNLSAVSGGGLNALSDGLNALNSKVANIDTSTTISDLTNIPVNTKGRIKLAGTISPTGGGQTVDYICIGNSTDRTLIIDYIANGTTYINRYSGSAWSGWDSLALKSDITNIPTFKSFQIPANSSITLTITGRSVITAIGDANGRNMYICRVAGGALAIDELGTSSKISTSISGTNLTLTSTESTVVFLYATIYSGDVST